AFAAVVSKAAFSARLASMNFRSKRATTRKGGAPRSAARFAAIISASSAVLLSRSVVNWATPAPRRAGISGSASRPPCGAAMIIGKPPASTVTACAGSAPARPGDRRASANSAERAEGAITSGLIKKTLALHTARRALGATLRNNFAKEFTGADRKGLPAVAGRKTLFARGLLFRLRHFRGELFQKVGRKRLGLELARLFHSKPGFRVALLIVEGDGPFAPAGREFRIVLEAFAEARVGEHEMLRALQLFFPGQGRRVGGMHRAEIAEQRHALGRVFEQLARLLQLLDGLAEPAAFAQHRAEAPEGAVVLRIQKPGLIETLHGEIELLRADRGPALGGERVAGSLAIAVAQSGVEDEGFVGLFLLVRARDPGLAEHRQGVGRRIFGRRQRRRKPKQERRNAAQPRHRAHKTLQIALPHQNAAFDRDSRAVTNTLGFLDTLKVLRIF